MLRCLWVPMTRLVDDDGKQQLTEDQRKLLDLPLGSFFRGSMPSDGTHECLRDWIDVLVAVSQSKKFFTWIETRKEEWKLPLVSFSASFVLFEIACLAVELHRLLAAAPVPDIQGQQSVECKRWRLVLHCCANAGILFVLLRR
jgi:hypothetical protein